jgi:hypothetical protein
MNGITMDDTDKLEKYLKGITPPAYESAEHRQRLRGQVLDQLAANRFSNVAKRSWKVATLISGLLCTGVLLAQVAVQVQRYFFQGRTRDGAYQFSTLPKTIYVGPPTGSTGSLQGLKVVQVQTTKVDPEDLGAGGVEQMRKDLEEMELLKQQGLREIIGVTDTEVSGYRLGRVFEYKYVLTDGRVKTMREGESDSMSASSPDQIEKDQQQIAELRQLSQREISSVVETEVAGKISRTLICLYVLSDGREITMGEGDPSAGTSFQMLTEAQWNELARLKGLKAGNFIGTEEKQLLGRTFTFQRYAYKLADGTVAISSEGQPTGLKRNLTEENWDEVANLRKVGAGESLGHYEEQIGGKVFNFEKKRYILSDGTEVIRANGAPKANN